MTTLSAYVTGPSDFSLRDAIETVRPHAEAGRGDLYGDPDGWSWSEVLDTKSIGFDPDDFPNGIRVYQGTFDNPNVAERAA